MIAILKISVILCCGLIAYQDFKDRMVVWFIFPLTGLLLLLLQVFNSDWQTASIFALANSILVTVVLIILFMYTELVLKKTFLNTSLGLGDILFFYAFALGFPSFTFVLLFVASILFSLIAFELSKRIRPSRTVPLAGLMGSFIIAVLITSFSPNIPSLFII